MAIETSLQTPGLPRLLGFRLSRRVSSPSHADIDELGSPPNRVDTRCDTRDTTGWPVSETVERSFFKGGQKGFGKGKGKKGFQNDGAYRNDGYFRRW